ncbi:uncharacterized protein LOC110823804 [Carica papaya]|uniref:uncharacterized protein LOC110823804 n=1 Tax=Carica papaya TaxID=3649 RepID=UPI000B8D093F|nr:uncharacterized protein LOC110823804 [Carica papaya]XP_021909975.1 uncharacterized protein LOC110823804 [Carica papaya]
MLNQLGGKWAALSSSAIFPVFSRLNTSLRQRIVPDIAVVSAVKVLKLSKQEAFSSRSRCDARRRVRYEDEYEEDEYNEEIAMLELYSQSARGEALIVHALVDEQDVEVLILKGFSSCLSYGTSPDLSTSVIPAGALIRSVDRIKGPFDPSNIEYLEKGLTWADFKRRLLLPNQP